MLPTAHVLDLIKGANRPAKTASDIKREFIDKHLHKWAVIHRQYNSKTKQNMHDIKSVHDTFDDVPFHELGDRDYLVHPVTDEMRDLSFTGHEKHI